MRNEKYQVGQVIDPPVAFLMKSRKDYYIVSQLVVTKIGRKYIHFDMYQAIKNSKREKIKLDQVHLQELEKTLKYLSPNTVRYILEE